MPPPLKYAPVNNTLSKRQNIVILVQKNLIRSDDLIGLSAETIKTTNPFFARNFINVYLAPKPNSVKGVKDKTTWDIVSQNE